MKPFERKMIQLPTPRGKLILTIDLTRQEVSYAISGDDTDAVLVMRNYHMEALIEQMSGNEKDALRTVTAILFGLAYDVVASMDAAIEEPWVVSSVPYPDADGEYVGNWEMLLRGKERAADYWSGHNPIRVYLHNIGVSGPRGPYTLEIEVGGVGVHSMLIDVPNGGLKLAQSYAKLHARLWLTELMTAIAKQRGFKWFTESMTEGADNE